MAIHIGSWGLPEFGISEAIGNVLGAGRTAPGGSNIITGSGAPTAQVPSASGYTPLFGPGLGWEQNYSQPISSPTPQQYSAPSGSSSGQILGASVNNEPYNPSPEEIAAQQARDQYNQSLNSYISDLDNMLNSGLPSQRANQETIVNTGYNQGLSDLNLQKTQGLDALTGQRTSAETNRVKSLKDLSGNMRNMFMAGNNYLGALGASDSSAANQYSYALTKLSNKQRGDINSQTSGIMNEIGQRETNLNQIYSNELQRLDSDKTTKLAQISNWFSEQSQLLIGQKAQVVQQQSEQMLNYALSQLQTVQTQAANQRAGLESWALSNSKNINELKANMQQISSFAPKLPQTQPINGQIAYAPTGGSQQYWSTGSQTTEKQQNPYSWIA